MLVTDINVFTFCCVLMSDLVLVSYKLAVDSGFAPNPFWGQLTLATCKPGIRSTRTKGEWIAGFTSKALCNDPVGEERLIYLMQIDEVVSFAQYYQSRKFRKKIPIPTSDDYRYCVGDNIYIPKSNGEFEQIQDAQHDEWNKENDLSCLNVLVAKRYVYFGRNPLFIPEKLRPNLPSGQSRYGVKTPSDRIPAFLNFVEHKAGKFGFDANIKAMPTCWTDNQLLSSKRGCSSQQIKC